MEPDQLQNDVDEIVLSMASHSITEKDGRYARGWPKIGCQVDEKGCYRKEHTNQPLLSHLVRCYCQLLAENGAELQHAPQLSKLDGS